MRILKLSLLIAVSLAQGQVAFAADGVESLEAAFGRKQWNEAAELGYEILSRQPSNSAVRLRTAYALFQRGYPNSALLILKKIPAADWKSLVEKQDRLVEIVALFQKKVPINIVPARLDQMNADASSSGIRDEILFAKGRVAFEKKEYPLAKEQLLQVSKASRYYGPASYLLGTIAVIEGKNTAAASEFSKIFEPQILSQGSEFWQEVGSDFNQHWANSLNVQMGTDALAKAGKLADLAMMALARVDYATHAYNDAMAKYAKIPKESPLYSRARLEEVWTLLALNRHDDAQQAAAALAVEDKSFEALEARPVRALILTDAGRTAESRTEVEAFIKVYDATKNALNRFKQFPNPASLPGFVQADFANDLRLQGVDEYVKSIHAEMESLRQEDRALFPVYGNMTADLEPMTSQAKEMATRIRADHINRRLSDLERLYVQSKLILAETYLADRENLRNEFKNAGDDVERQKEHDRRLVELLQKAVTEIDGAMKSVKERHLALEFRQSELLWELSSATAILSQTSNKQEDRDLADQYRLRSLTIARDIADHNPTFAKHAQAMFFVGFAMLEMDRVADGRDYLEKFVAKYPQHQHVPDAYRILGDIEFDNNKFATAEAYYSHIMRFPTSSVIGYALYKMGWCAYNQHKLGKALLGLEQAILWAKSLENSSQILSLKREARRDLIGIFAEIGDHKKALEYFDRFIGGDSASWLGELAKGYDDNGLFEKSTYLYKQLLALDPPAEQKMVYQTRMIHGAYQLRNWQLVIDATKELVASYSELLKEKPTDPAAPAIQVEKTVNDVALAQHFEFAKAETPADVERVLLMDQLYLQAFSQWPESETPLYQYAHFLLKHKQVNPAVDAFRDHWARFSTTIKEPLREEALRNLVHALEVQDEAHKPDKDLPIPARELLKFAEQYVTEYPKAKFSRPIAFLRTVTYFKYNQTKDGIAETQKVFDAAPVDDFGKRAFNNLKVSYYNLKDWKTTHEWANMMLAKPELVNSEYVKDLKTIREESLFLWADNTADNVEAANLYLRVAHDPSMERLRDKAYHNAFIRFQKADKHVEALQTAAELEKVSPGFKDLNSLAAVRAALYEDAGDYENALPLFITFLKAPPPDADPDAVQQARLHAGLLSEAEGKREDAGTLFKMYLANAGNGKDTPGMAEARRGLTRLADTGNRQPAAQFRRWDAMKAMEADLEKQPLPPGNDLAGRIQGGAGKLQKAIKEFLDVSGDAATPPSYAFEAYCTVPFLYGYYQAGVRALGAGQPPELVAELEKLVAPLDGKATELATECVNRAQNNFHDGPVYRKVLGKWGWEADKAKKEKVDKVIQLLAGKAPWIDPAPVALEEKAILLQHLQNGSTPDSWYSLAKQRLDSNHAGLARITFLAALTKSPNAPRILNALAVTAQMNGADQVTASVMYERAAGAGSGLANANLALIHLNGGRLDKGSEVLKAAQEAGVFANDSSLLAAVTEMLAPPPPPPSVTPGTETPAPAATTAAATPAPTPIETPAPVASAAPTTPAPQASETPAAAVVTATQAPVAPQASETPAAAVVTATQAPAAPTAAVVTVTQAPVAPQASEAPTAAVVTATQAPVAPTAAVVTATQAPVSPQASEAPTAAVVTATQAPVSPQASEAPAAPTAAVVTATQAPVSPQASEAPAAAVVTATQAPATAVVTATQAPTAPPASETPAAVVNATQASPSATPGQADAVAKTATEPAPASGPTFVPLESAVRRDISSTPGGAK